MAEENKTGMQGGGAIPADVERKFESSKTHVRKAANDLKSAATSAAGDLKTAAGAMAGEYRDKAEQAYRRGDALEKRRAMMEAWANWCEPKSKDNVVPFAKVEGK